MFKPVFNLKNAYYESWKKLPLPRIASTAHLRRSFLTTLASPLRFFLLILLSTRAFSVAAWNPDHGIYLTGLRQLRVYMNDCPRLPADRRGKTEEQNKWVKQIESIVNDDPEFRNKVVHTTYRKIAFKNGYYDCDKKLCATTTSHGIPQIINRFRVHGWRRATVSARQGIFLPPTSSTTSRAPRSRSSPFPRLAPHPTPSDQSRPR